MFVFPLLAFPHEPVMPLLLGVLFFHPPLALSAGSIIVVHNGTFAIGLRAFIFFAAVWTNVKAKFTHITPAMLIIS
jgi:hypothetical protein